MIFSRFFVCVSFGFCPKNTFFSTKNRRAAEAKSATFKNDLNYRAW